MEYFIPQEDWDKLNETTKLDELYHAEIVGESDLDNIAFVIFGLNIYLMQWGFALLEAGSVRSKSTTNILLKNLIDAFVGAICFYIIGYGLAFGTGNGFVGTNYFLLIQDESQCPFYFFQYAFVVTSSTIVSGSMAERTDIRAYFLFAILYTTIVYPIAAHWTWSPIGWLYNLDYHDLAGSSVVHCTGGVAGLIGAIFLGKREVVDYGRMRGHSTALVAIGYFLLSYGFLALTGGSLYRASGGNSANLGQVVTNTTTAGSAGGLVALFLRYILTKKLSLLSTINGSLAGFVSICASADVTSPWIGLIIGGFGGAVYIGWSSLLVRFDVDDPLEASSVHLGAGLWGVFATGLFSTQTGLFFTGNWMQLGINTMGGLVITLWSAFWSTILFSTLKRFKMLRVSEKAELEGLDSYKHNENAYPEIVELSLKITELSEEIFLMKKNQL